MLTLNFKPFPVIETKRLVLKQITLSHLDSFFAIRSNVDLMNKLDKEPAKSVEEIRILIEAMNRSLEAGTGITWGVFLSADQSHIGNISFHKIYPEHHRAEIGYALLPSFRRMGIMQEAIEEVIKFGFEQMNLHSIEAKINPINDASRSILEKNGFVKEAHLKESFLFRGVFSDTGIYSLIKTN